VKNVRIRIKDDLIKHPITFILIFNVEMGLNRRTHYLLRKII